jgi:hypothetical protein
LAKSAQTPVTGHNDVNMLDFLVRRALLDVHTALPCKVVESFPLAPGDERLNKDGIAGLVHVELQIDQVDTSDCPIDAGRIYNVPYFRLQAGIAAIVVDPVPGDLGWLSFGERDMSLWKNRRVKEMPATKRILSQSDPVYFPGILNAPPKIWIRLREDGIYIEGNDQPVNVRTDGDISMKAGGKIDIAADGDVTVKGANIYLN